MLRFLSLACVALPLASGHGVITEIKGPSSQTACAVNTPGVCNGALKLREVIPRSGNDGVCGQPPGCEASFKCDHCGLEKTVTRPRASFANTLPQGGWWTANPAMHWDEPAVWPQNVCMSKDGFGARGIMKVAPGDSLDTTFYVNADHSGIYQWQLSCGESHTNQKFFNGPITQWKTLHISKDTTPENIPNREVGWTRQQTDEYFKKTKCTGAGCSYRMNRGIQPANSGHCQSNKDDCFVNDRIQIPADTKCAGGKATLRWMWFSAEGIEAYSNCLDLEVTGATGTQPTVAPAPTPTGNTGNCGVGGNCASTPGCCNAGTKCFEKDQYYAACLATCTPGINPNDPPQYQTPWSCKELSAGPEPTPQPQNCAGRWGQCGGKNHKGATCCNAGNTCVVGNEWYSQCRPSGYAAESDATAGDECDDVSLAAHIFGLEKACNCDEAFCLDQACEKMYDPELPGCKEIMELIGTCEKKKDFKTKVDTCPRPSDPSETSAAESHSYPWSLSLLVFGLLALR